MYTNKRPLLAGEISIARLAWLKSEWRLFVINFYKTIAMLRLGELLSF
jgi:hypothetical protein